MLLVIGPTQAAVRFTGENGATRPAPIPAALTTMQVPARLALAAQQPVMALLAAIPAVTAAAADSDTAMA